MSSRYNFTTRQLIEAVFWLSLSLGLFIAMPWPKIIGKVEGGDEHTVTVFFVEALGLGTALGAAIGTMFKRQLYFALIGILALPILLPILAYTIFLIHEHWH